MSQPPSISEMISQSIQVLQKPKAATFEQFENKGTLREALVYVALCAAVSGLVGALPRGPMGFVAGVATAVIGFLVFTYVVHAFGKGQGGTGTLDQVAYSFSLFWGPISVVSSLLVLVLVVTIVGLLLVPAVLLATLAANVYFAYLAIQSSMNMTESSKVWITLLVAAGATFISFMLVGALLG
ncbi:MAG: YIP1 family protein [Deinococcus sp.]|nr:YIP1 family protein [Deinococcus sp.]MCL5965515.1 YIP1 family protein [Deinococcus sp.]